MVRQRFFALLRLGKDEIWPGTRIFLLDGRNRQVADRQRYTALNPRYLPISFSKQGDG